MAKKIFPITLYMSEIVYEVKNKTYITGRSRQEEGNYEEVANMQVNDDDENMDEVLRSIGNAFATLKNKLSEYISETENTRIGTDNILLDATGELVVTLVMPSNFNLAAKDTIAAGMHQYIVDTAIGNWFDKTNKDDAEGYYTLAAANLNLIREAVNKRVRPRR